MAPSGMGGTPRHVRDLCRVSRTVVTGGRLSGSISAHGSPSSPARSMRCSSCPHLLDVGAQQGLYRLAVKLVSPVAGQSLSAGLVVVPAGEVRAVVVDMHRNVLDATGGASNILQPRVDVRREAHVTQAFIQRPGDSWEAAQSVAEGSA